MICRLKIMNQLKKKRDSMWGCRYKERDGREDESRAIECELVDHVGE